MTFPPRGVAIVKSVLSGDSVVLRGKPVAGMPAEEVLTLSNVIVPRFNRDSPQVLCISNSGLFLGSQRLSENFGSWQKCRVFSGTQFRWE